MVNVTGPRLPAKVIFCPGLPKSPTTNRGSATTFCHTARSVLNWLAR